MTTEQDVYRVNPPATVTERIKQLEQRTKYLEFCIGVILIINLIIAIVII
jgi:hypothetical protein